MSDMARASIRPGNPAARAALDRLQGRSVTHLRKVAEDPARGPAWIDGLVIPLIGFVKHVDHDVPGHPDRTGCSRWCTAFHSNAPIPCWRPSRPSDRRRPRGAGPTSAHAAEPHLDALGLEKKRLPGRRPASGLDPAGPVHHPPPPRHLRVDRQLVERFADSQSGPGTASHRGEVAVGGHTALGHLPRASWTLQSKSVSSIPHPHMVANSTEILADDRQLFHLSLNPAHSLTESLEVPTSRTVLQLFVQLAGLAADVDDPLLRGGSLLPKLR